VGGGGAVGVLEPHTLPVGAPPDAEGVPDAAAEALSAAGEGLAGADAVGGAGVGDAAPDAEAPFPREGVGGGEAVPAPVAEGAADAEGGPTVPVARIEGVETLLSEEAPLREEEGEAMGEREAEPPVEEGVPGAPPLGEGVPLRDAPPEALRSGEAVVGAVRLPCGDAEAAAEGVPGAAAEGEAVALPPPPTVPVPQALGGGEALPDSEKRALGVPKGDAVARSPVAEGVDDEEGEGGGVAEAGAVPVLAPLPVGAAGEAELAAEGDGKEEGELVAGAEAEAPGEALPGAGEPLTLALKHCAGDGEGGAVREPEAVPEGDGASAVGEGAPLPVAALEAEGASEGEGRGEGVPGAGVALPVAQPLPL
jgi:hypothetical protein